ncbi:MAG: hypothetical protein WA734_01540 [Candidatus Acidiferrales bacterium]
MKLKNPLMRISGSQKALLVLFLITLPLVNPWVRGDGVGYYAYVRAMLIEGRLDFVKDWQHANQSFQMYRVGPDGKPKQAGYTATGHLDNHFAIGPSILWSPFLIVVHGTVVLADRLGARIPADGFSWPYLDTMAFATALYGFLALLISFELARRYFPQRWALLATIGIWFASSLPVYMYFNPSWSHAHSAFIVALFLWYWDRTRGTRTIFQWAILGLIAGLLMDVYYPNVFLLLAPVMESLQHYYKGIRRSSNNRSLGQLVLGNLAFMVTTIIAFLPTPITRMVIYGRPFASGYGDVGKWSWLRPHLLRILFSSDHGLVSWTPIILFAALGLFVVLRLDRQLGAILITILFAYDYLIACSPFWDGLSSFGNRYFLPLTPIFIIGLAGTFTAIEEFWNAQRAKLLAYGATAILIVWNLGFIFQWGTHLVPARGPISWREMTHNQFTVVPVAIVDNVERYILHRHALMNDIEKSDVKQLEQTGPRPN